MNQVLTRTITVKVAPRGWLRKYIDFAQWQDLSLPEGSTLAGVEQALGLAAGSYLAEINGEEAGRESVLNDGDSIVLNPLVVGG